MISPASSLLVCASAVFIWGASTSMAEEADSAEEQTVNCDVIPAAVQMAFRKSFPNAAMDHCTEEEEFGEPAYEVASSERNTKRDVLFYSNGALIVVEEAIALADLPKPVRQSWEERFPNDIIVLAEKVTRDNTVMYEIQSLRATKPRETVFDASGRELTILSVPTR